MTTKTIQILLFVGIYAAALGVYALAATRSNRRQDRRCDRQAALDALLAPYTVTGTPDLSPQETPGGHGRG